MTVPGGGELHTGIPLPMPFTDEALALLVPRGAALNQRYDVPFLLENLTYYLPDLPADRGRDEVAFLNDFVEASGCGLLFDLYNFHCNAQNLVTGTPRSASSSRRARPAARSTPCCPGSRSTPRSGPGSPA